MKFPAAVGLLTMVFWALPAAAQVQVAYTARTVHLRAGPGSDYPVVATLAPGLQLLVQGCVPDYVWCDVVVGPNRGWVYAGSINYYYQNSYVPLLSYGAVIGIGVFPFVLHDYWGRYYYNRPWYGDRYRWERGGDHDRGDRGGLPGARIDPPAPAPWPRQSPPYPGYVAPRHGMPPGARAQPQPVPAPAPAQTPWPRPLPSVAPVQPQPPGVQPPRSAGPPSVAPAYPTRPGREVGGNRPHPRGAHDEEGQQQRNR